ncbi:hypothetical protein MMC30_007467 [Trapelia coarctata]|nr:hypothetical protein [Trapelia coarctata]
MALTAYSKTAEDIAAALLVFKEPVSNRATEITALISELFAISSALLELDTAQRDHPYHRLRREVEDDQRTAILSLDYTFRNVRRLLGDLGNPIYRSARESYQGVWHALERHFLQQADNALVQRLEYYRRFLLELGAIVQGYPPSRDMGDIRYRIEKLLQRQEDDEAANALVEGFGDMAIGAPRQPSWERMRPYGLEPVMNAPPPPIEVLRRPRSPEFNPWDYEPAPEPPMFEVPLSPTMSNTTTSTGSSRNIGPRLSDHWMTKVFSQPRSSTVFKVSGSESVFLVPLSAIPTCSNDNRSKCFGEHMPYAKSGLSDEYDLILEL